MFRGALTLFLLVTMIPAVQAAPIATRAGLQAILGGAGSLEDFESFEIELFGATTLNCAALTSTAVCNGQGPGLVIAGVSFVFTGTGQWNGQSYFGSPSKELLSNGQPLVVDFSSPVGAFGVDLRAYSNFPTTAAMAIYATDDTTLLGTITSISLGATGLPVFVGWEHAPGIGSFSLTQTTYPWSPIIDNLEFGSAGVDIPEPASALLLAAGLISLRLLRAKA